MMSLKENKEVVFKAVNEATLSAGRSEDSVSIIAVTKYVDSDIARQLVDTGVSHIAENRVDKFLDKYKALKDCQLTWHLIGSLQRRKVKDVINYVDYFHALDSVSLAKEIQKRAEHPINCFLQVNVSGEESKHGFAPEEVSHVLDQLADYDQIRLIGLMTMAPFEADQSTIAEIFKETNQLRQRLQAENRKNMPFTELSMGMSNDFPIAIQEGATFVRIGTSFFK